MGMNMKPTRTRKKTPGTASTGGKTSTSKSTPKRGTRSLGPKASGVTFGKLHRHLLHHVKKLTTRKPTYPKLTTRKPAHLLAGTPVRIREAAPPLTLRTPTGVVLREDKWQDYYIILLDQPAIYRHADGREEELSEIREDIDNMDVLPLRTI